ncbi:MAG: Gfo/Idh/MocA family oxidoreductase [Verrucomicrobia bacterium]|nr:Gfo/Idh/MocA family oxidoreductase [Verrucomicrobiota bacterium]
MNTPTSIASSPERHLSRRSFLRHSSLAMAGAAAASQLPFALTSHAAPDDPIRIGVIGCGGRGTGAVLNVLGAATKVIYPSAGFHTEDVDKSAKVTNKSVAVVALADVFPDRLARCRENLQALQINIPDDHCFTGFDSYKQLLALPDVNYVIMATPPHFRPAHLKAAIEAGKHCFIEKPAAVDGPGVRLLLEAGELAKQKNLGIVAGTQRRHGRGYQEAIKRIRDGALGDLIYGRCYWNGGEIWVIDRKDGWSDIEWQLRNWNYFTWLGGDHIVEQHVHNLDIMNWAIGAHPIKATALGGRQVRTQPVHGHIYDHFAVEYEYPNGVRMFSQCRQINGCEGKVEEWLMGSKGVSNCHNYIKAGADMWRFREGDGDAYQQEHLDLIASIRAGQPLNEAQAVAESTLTGIMGRESAYSGQSIEWDQALHAQTRLGPEKYEFGPFPVPPVALPGKYRLV